MEQVINDFFAKTLRIILEARSPNGQSQNYNAKPLISPPPSSSRDEWFNLALRNCPSAVASFGKWHQNCCDQLVIDIILIQDKCEKIIERWLVQYGNSEGNKLTNDSNSMYETAYVKTAILLQNLYATLRFLPAYKIFQELNLSGKVCNYSLSHKISAFVPPFNREEDSKMKDFIFVPIETPCCVLSLSVSYETTIDCRSSEASIPTSVQVIPNYIGSPNIDFRRKLSVLPSAESLPPYISLTQEHDMAKEYKAPSSFPATSSYTIVPDNWLSLLSIINTKIKKYSCSPRFSIRGFVRQGFPMRNRSGESNACVTLQKDGISRFYLMDETEDEHFCPFAGDDEISTDLLSLGTQSRDNIAANNLVSEEETPIIKSQDALYGVLIKKLKASTPIRKKPLMTYADSIKELRSYDAITKLLQQGGISSLHVC